MARKVKRVVKHSDPSQELGFRLNCPGCKRSHVIYTRPWDSGSYVDGVWAAKAGHVWEFLNNDLERPTFHPSLLIYEGRWDDGEIAHPRCHSWIRNGRIEFLGDCGHALAGQTVDLPDIDAVHTEN